MKKRIIFCTELLLPIVLAACSPIRIPTAAVPKPTAAANPLFTRIPQPTLIDTSTPTAIATETPLRTSTPTALPSPAPTPIAYDRNPRAILIEVDVWGGLAPVLRDSHVPMWRLYGDGLVVFAGEGAALSTGLDAVVYVGHLSDGEIQSLLAYVDQAGFFALQEYYEPRPKPTDLPTARISVYLSKTKTVRVYGPEHENTPQAFSAAFQRITQSIPSDAQVSPPTSAYLVATDAGAVGNLPVSNNLADWTVTSVRLADADGGITVGGNAYLQIAALRANKPSNTLYREGEHAYNVRFVPNLPRAVHLTDWLGVILNAPREFDGRIFEIVGYYRGWNLLGEARGTPPTRSDWVIADDSGAMYVTGGAPRSLDPGSRTDTWNVVRLTASVAYVRSGTSYLEARRVEVLTPEAGATSAPSSSVTPTNTPTPLLLANADAAIAAVKARFSEVARIQKAAPGIIGFSTDIKVFDLGDGWEIAFWEGWDDCMVRCVNNRYYYFTVRKDGRIAKNGEYQIIYNADADLYETVGVPMWGIPK